MSVKSVFLHLTRIWLSGGRWAVLLLGLIVVAWSYAALFWRAVPTAAELAAAHPLEKAQFEMVQQTRADQKLDFTQGVSEPLNNWLPHRTDGLVRPLWPWLAAWFLDADTVAAESPRFVCRVHLAKLAATLGLLILLGLASARVFSVPASLLLVFLTGHGVLLPAAGPFLPDLAFSIWFFLVWMACLAALKRNSLWLYGTIGVLSALANLTAPSTTSLVAVFVFVSSLRWFWAWLLEQLSGIGASQWVWRNHWLGMILLVVCHLFTVGPMLSHAHQKLGDASPFHWRWFDSTEAMQQWTAAHHTRETLRALPADQRPSFENYRASHSDEEMRERLLQGTRHVAGTVLMTDWKQHFPRGLFVWALAGVFLIQILMLGCLAPKAAHAGHALHPESAPMALFTVLALVVCGLDFGWDVRVLDLGHRELALFPPLVLSLLWACEDMVTCLRRRKTRLPVLVSYELLLWLLLGAGAWWVIVFLQPTANAA